MLIKYDNFNTLEIDNGYLTLSGLKQSILKKIANGEHNESTHIHIEDVYGMTDSYRMDEIRPTFVYGKMKKVEIPIDTTENVN